MADPSKTETATPRRREEARKKGQVARSTELNTALGILGALVVLQLCGPFMFAELTKVSRFFWGNLQRDDMGMANLQANSLTLGLELLYIMAPLLLGAVVIGLFSNAIQVGLVLSPEVLTLKFENLNPVKGFGRIFSRRSGIELFKSLLKVGLVGTVAWYAIAGKMDSILALMNTDLGLFWSSIGGLASVLMLRIGLTLLALAGADYLYQRYEYEQSIKMSKQEVKDEFRQMEGDPQVKARIRRLQQEASRRRMLAELPNADVIITNPTHLAVAVKYDETNMDAPRVIAKGARLLAQRIKEIGREHNIPIMENKPLARALFESTPVGGQVPSALFDAVAQLLAFVYQMQGKLAEKARKNRERIAKKGGLVLSQPSGENSVI
ncbi:MAG: flagellar biosynthesis protein FlhB [candidate division FCPU426 bacterium]